MYSINVVVQVVAVLVTLRYNPNTAKSIVAKYVLNYACHPDHWSAAPNFAKSIGANIRTGFVRSASWVKPAVFVGSIVVKFVLAVHVLKTRPEIHVRITFLTKINLILQLLMLSSDG